MSGAVENWADPVFNRADRGAFHRRYVALASLSPAGDGICRAAMEDEPHRFEVTIQHDGERVIGISANSPRIPWTTCGAAEEVLPRFIGERIAPGSGDDIRPAPFCTHMYYVARLAIAQAGRSVSSGEMLRQYDLRIRDRIFGVTRGEIYRNGALALALDVSDRTIVAPAQFVGADFKKRLDWGDARPDADALEAAMLLRTGIMVANSLTPALASYRRGWPMDTTPRDKASMEGACYTYSGARLDLGRPVYSWTDMADRREDLLTDFPGMRRFADLSADSQSGR